MVVVVVLVQKSLVLVVDAYTHACVPMHVSVHAAEPEKGPHDDHVVAWLHQDLNVRGCVQILVPWRM